MTKEDFIEDTPVTMNIDGKRVFGEVVAFDDLMNKVFIRWDDLDEPCWHGEDEFDKIEMNYT